jgi:predicted phage baseplate assembly protein
VTGINEVLGTSNGQPKQTFKTTRAPVLEGQKLEVREQIMPSVEECRNVMAEEGDDAIQPITVLAGKGDEFWVRWHEVANFYHSRSRDRHYILNRATGEITFGDGTHGMIPPFLPGNIRLASYRTGGGVIGNKLALTIKQLKSAVPYIKSAMNWEAADGGADEESVAALLERGPTQIRHGGRAVTTQDFEDLARRVSPEVARAMCVPLYDLVADSAMQNRKLGVVSVIVVPQSAEPKPFPSSDLLLRVQSALRSSVPPAADVRVLGPEYVAADVDVSIAVTDPDTVGDVKLAVTLAINHYLHPVNGGLDESGWEFGRLPQKSELFSLIEGIPGVHHVIGLKLDIAGGRTATSERNRFLSCAGRVGVSAVLEEQPS